MDFPKFIFFLVLLSTVIFISFLVGAFFNINLFCWESYQFLSFAVLGVFVYYTNKFFRFVDSIIAVFFLSIVNTYFLTKTSLFLQITSIIHLFIYSSAIFSLVLICFKLIWFRKQFRVFRNITFSIFAAFSYTLVQYFTHILTKNMPQSTFVLRYFIYGFLIWLTISLAFSISEILFSQLENIWKLPERIKFEDEENISDENDIDDDTS